MRKPYTQEQIEFLVECGKTMTPAEIVLAYNDKYHEGRTKRGIRDFMTSKGISFVYTKNTWADGFTEEQKSFMRMYGDKMSRQKLTDKFNDTFGTSVSYNTIRGWCIRNKIASPNGDCKFTSETSPRWAMGLSKEEFRSHYSEESYSEMTKQKNVKHHIGDEVIRHGIPHICVNDEFCQGIDHRLEKKDRYVWEQANGVIPEDHMIIHLDNDHMNCNLDNLRCIPTRFRTFLAKNRWWDASPDMKEAILKWCELFYALQDAKQNAEP